MKDMEISKVLNLAKSNKYATACAAFDLVDHIFKVDVPKQLKSRKLSVQAMSLLQEGSIKFGFEAEHPETKPARPSKTAASEEE